MYYATIHIWKKLDSKWAIECLVLVRRVAWHISFYKYFYINGDHNICKYQTRSMGVMSKFLLGWVVSPSLYYFQFFHKTNTKK